MLLHVLLLLHMLWIHMLPAYLLHIIAYGARHVPYPTPL